MELKEGSETSAISNKTPGKHPKENILHVKHGESLKSRILTFVYGSTCFGTFSAHHQCGFRRNRSTADHIFCIRQILEKKWEHNEAVHQLFIDFQQA
jgi:hypothetical protein